MFEITGTGADAHCDEILTALFEYTLSLAAAGVQHPQALVSG